MKNLTLASAAVLCMAGVATADYQIDNDEFNTNIGVPGGSITWGNAFETTDTMLENIAFGFGINQTGTMVGDEMLWEVFGAQGNNPTFITSLAAGLHTVESDDWGNNGNLDVITVDVDLSGSNLTRIPAFQFAWISFPSYSPLASLYTCKEEATRR